MNTKQLATLLNGTEYPLRISNELSQQASEHGLVIVYGASDDLIEFAGAINDELCAYDGDQYLLDKKGILPNYYDIDEESVMEDYMSRKNNVAVLNSLWCKTDKYSFTYETDIPHEKFDVVEGDGFYCQGIVFDINKLEVPTILFYDTETTGLPNWKTPSGGDDQPHMVQIAAILCNADTGQAIKTMNVIVKPDGWTIPQDTIDVHGITNEYALEHGIPEKEAIQQLLDLRGSAEREAQAKIEAQEKRIRDEERAKVEAEQKSEAERIAQIKANDAELQKRDQQKLIEKIQPEEHAKVETEQQAETYPVKGTDPNFKGVCNQTESTTNQRLAERFEESKVSTEQPLTKKEQMNRALKFWKDEYSVRDNEFNDLMNIINQYI